MMDCISSELKNVDDRSLIKYVAESIPKKEICSLYQSFCEQEEMFFCNEVKEENKNDTYEDSECEEVDDTLTCRYTIGEQKKEEKEKEKQQQETLYPYIENNLGVENHQKLVDVKGIIGFWDCNGFGLSNINAKQQLLSWLEDSRFLQPFLYSP